MGRPVTLFTGQWADLPLEGAGRQGGGVGLRRPGAGLLGRPLRGGQGARGRRLRGGQARAARPSRTQVLRDQQPPGRPVRVRLPYRRPPPGHAAARDLGRRRSGGGQAALRRTDEGDRPRRRRVRGGHGRRLHGLQGLVRGRRLPAGGRRHDRRRLPGLRRPLEPDPGRLRRGGRALRAGGAPVGDRLRLLDHAAHPGGRRPAARLRDQLRSQPPGVADGRPGAVRLWTSPTASTTPTSRNRSSTTTAATARWRRTCRSGTCAAAGTSCRRGAATCRSNGCSVP